MNNFSRAMALAVIFATPLFARDPDAPLTLKEVRLTSKYPWKRNIVTTHFWIGEGSSGYNAMTNYKSAWDGAWTRNYGGVDCPQKRVNAVLAGATSLPKKFAPTLNPFYVALPFNDVKYPQLARKYVPWWDPEEWQKSGHRSQCKGRWVMIEYKGRVVFAQWEDVGPFRYDHVKYVFGDERPRIHSNAGLDISPAVKDYLGFADLDRASWRFVENSEVPYGPWIEYGELAILYSAIKKESRSKKVDEG
ncbi:MAG: hypothetical protein V1746_03545 [bacterium]